MKVSRASLLHKGLIAVAVILLPVIVTFLLTYTKGKRHLKTNELDDLTVMAEAYEGQVYQFIEMSRRRAADFSTDGSIREETGRLVSGDLSRVKPLSDYLSTYKLPLDNKLTRISIISLDGRVLASTDASRTGADVSGKRFFKRAGAGGGMDVNETNIEGRAPEMASFAAIKDPATGRPMAWIANFEYLSNLSDVLSGRFNRDLGALSWNRGKKKTMQVYIVNSQGFMITESVFVKNAVWRQRVDSLPIRECVENGREVTAFYRDYRGVEVAGSSMCLPRMGWTLMVEVDSSEMLAHLDVMRRNATFAAVIVAGLIGVLLALFYRIVVRRLYLLAAATASIAAGDYDVTLPVESGDEIGALSEAFNAMAREIKDRTDMLRESEEKYRSLVSNIPDVTWTATPGGDMVFISRNAEDVFGYTPMEIMSRNKFCPDCIGPDELMRVAASYEALFEGNTGFDEEYRVRRKDGQWIWVNDRATATHEKNGVTYAVGVISDITQRRLAEEARDELRQRYEQLVNNLAVGVYRDTQGSDGHIVEANRAALKIVEAGSKEELLGHRMSDFYLNGGKQREFMEKMLKYGYVKNEDLELKTLKGGRFWASITAVMKKDSAGDVYFDGIIEDITERKKLEDQLRHAQKMEAVGQLAGGIAHDFNNILTALIGYGNLLLMKRGEDGLVKEFATNMLNLSEKASSLTQGLLAFGRKQVMNTQPVDLNELVRKVEKILFRLIGEDVELKTVLSEEEITVKADAAQIEHVLMNLATNARDAMPKGGTMTIQTKIAGRDGGLAGGRGYGGDGKCACIIFSDTGTGMDAAVRPKIFEPFFTTKEVGKGTGLGLSMVYGIIKQHGGSIDVRSETGKGTAFRIYLPLAVAEAKAKDKAGVELKPGTETVLLAEDEEDVRGIEKAMLEEFGYTVITAFDGEDAVARYKEKKGEIALLILDMVMPKKNGKEVYDEIIKINPDVKVLFMSGYASGVMRARGVDAGDKNFIPKPVTPNEFIARVREVIDG